MEHPSTFPSILRRDRQSPSVTPPRRDTPSPTQRYNTKRHSMGSFPNLSRANIVNYNRRDSTASNGVREMKRDYVGSMSSLPRKTSREYIGSMSSLSRKSSIDTKKSSTDSLDFWHSSWDAEKNDSVSSLAHDDRLSYGHKVIILNKANTVPLMDNIPVWSITTMMHIHGGLHHRFSCTYKQKNSCIYDLRRIILCLSNIIQYIYRQ